MAGANSGLFGQLQQSLGTVIELLRLRLALLGTELGLEKQRLAVGLFWGACALLSLTVAAVLFCGFVILLLWDGYRLAAVGVLALLFLAGGWLMLKAAQRQLSAGSNLFSVSLAELERDRDSFTAATPHEPQ
ncbi:phage holin family protein [Rhodoferax sp.]|uniref:phage holin family protein n=1 Tax=Rhodoferax sp. TaxID=50421 RepID=UPI0026130BA3|nr:phage holin family protein [Rhodoferax sp.]MDD2919963.1 phage holin family protein [Rhodoferax sp.]